MSLHISEQEYHALLERKKGRGQIVSTPGRSKFNAVVCETDNLHFPSKKHRAFYIQLQAQKQAKMIRYFLREVPFDLPGHYDNGRVIRHYVDFAVCQNDNTFIFYEVKGRDIPLGRVKRLQVEALYNIHIELI